jgi:Metallo-beta-lactamase superfamily domain
MQAPVYATVPVQRMGQVTMRDACRARAEATEAPPFSLADVDRAFAHITQLRWRQTVNLPGALPLHLMCAVSLTSEGSSCRAAGLLFMSGMLLNKVTTCVTCVNVHKRRTHHARIRL